MPEFKNVYLPPPAAVRQAWGRDLGLLQRSQAERGGAGPSASMNCAAAFFGQKEIHGSNNFPAWRFNAGVVVIPERFGGSPRSVQSIRSVHFDQTVRKYPCPYIAAHFVAPVVSNDVIEPGTSRRECDWSHQKRYGFWNFRASELGLGRLEYRFIGVNP